MLLFWSMFLPLGTVWSVDEKNRILSGHGAKTAGSDLLHRLASMALIIQIFSVYSVAGFIKLNEATWREGTGLYHALSSDQFSTRLANWILSRNWDLSWMNMQHLELSS